MKLQRCFGYSLRCVSFGAERILNEPKVGMGVGALVVVAVFVVVVAAVVLVVVVVVGGVRGLIK